MTTNTDFLALYQQLRLDAGCSVAELKRAYRRRVAELHPDRRAQPGDAAVAAELQELNASYAAAMAFARRHGRLPGSTRPRSAQASVPLHPSAPPASAPSAPPTALPHRAVLVVAVLVALAWAMLPNGQRADRDASPAAPTAATVRDTGPRQLAVGMTRQQVRAREGAPSAWSDRRWEYGPSWVEFEHGVVSDWYSSPLRPLHVDTRRAGDARTASDP